MVLFKSEQSSEKLESQINDNLVYPVTALPMMIFGMIHLTYGHRPFKSVRVYSFKVSQGSSITCDLVPYLTADGTPCMYDKVSGQCFYNAGTGTFGYRVKTTGATHAPMSLRDPYYTAPSGVYARPSGENQLEILADTEEPTGDGWEWFANTGEAYEHFGIKQEELLTNESTND